ncbi:2TM domain-containing protein [Altibacter sp. HG106]|uniref:2TM domain-containing protein n=1 Tax=Altibacter sp. HG106 TaxID=3023937 RepID=UPI002350331E|nr:2TM domain-containing protein [Altibacter sp. HG106]MDC7993819.1 2TM domain-containing protein [Altibacter sp. HG106]
MRTYTELPQSKRQRAEAYVKELRSFYGHLVIYLLFVPVFVILNILGSDFPWALFPIIGWGIGVLSHASETFGWNPFFSKDWESRKIQEFMDNELNR